MIGDVDADDEFDERPMGSSPSGWETGRVPFSVTGGGCGSGGIGSCSGCCGVGGRGMLRNEAISVIDIPCMVMYGLSRAFAKVSKDVKMAGEVLIPLRIRDVSFCEILGFVIVINIRIHCGKSLSRGARAEVSQESESRLARRGGLPLRRASGGFWIGALGVLKVTFTGFPFWGWMVSACLCGDEVWVRSCIGEGEADLIMVGACTAFGRVGGGLGNLGFGDDDGVEIDDTCVGAIGAVVFVGRPGPRRCWFDGALGAGCVIWSVGLGGGTIGAGVADRVMTAKEDTVGMAIW